MPENGKFRMFRLEKENTLLSSSTKYLKGVTDVFSIVIRNRIKRNESEIQRYKYNCQNGNTMKKEKAYHANQTIHDLSTVKEEKNSDWGTALGNDVDSLNTRTCIYQDKASERIDEAFERIHEASERIDEASERIDEASERKDEASERIDKESERIDEASERIDEASERIDEASERKDEASDRIDKASERIDAASERIDEASERIDEASEGKDETSERIDEASERIDEASERKDEASERIDKAFERIDEASERIDEASERIDEASERKDEASERNDEASDRLDEASATIDEAFENIDENKCWKIVFLPLRAMKNFEANSEILCHVLKSTTKKEAIYFYNLLTTSYLQGQSRKLTFTKPGFTNFLRRYIYLKTKLVENINGNTIQSVADSEAVKVFLGELSPATPIVDQNKENLLYSLFPLDSDGFDSLAYIAQLPHIRDKQIKCRSKYVTKSKVLENELSFKRILYRTTETKDMRIYLKDIFTKYLTKYEAYTELLKCEKLIKTTDYLNIISISDLDIPISVLHEEIFNHKCSDKCEMNDILVYSNLDEFLSQTLDSNFNANEEKLYDLGRDCLLDFKYVLHGNSYDLLLHRYNTIIDGERRSKYRLVVVTAEVFENAMRQYQIEQYKVTSTNYFPKNCRMFLHIPVYKGGFINRRDTKDGALTNGIG